MKQSKTVLVCCLLSLVIITAPAYADQVEERVELKSKISSVTVFSDRAQVTRTAVTQLAKGEHKLLFSDLPNVIDRDTIQVDGKGNFILKDVKFDVEHFTEVPDIDQKALLDKRQKLYDSITEARNIINHANSEKSFLEKITNKLTGITEKSNDIELDPEKWMKMVKFYREKYDALDKEILETEKQKRDLQKKLEKLGKDLATAGNVIRKSKNIVKVTVQAESAGSMTINLSYVVRGPGWSPVYDLRVSSEKKTMNLTYNATIMQNTTEDWDDVEIKLSTARPNIGGQQPELSPWYVNFYREKGWALEAKAKTKPRKVAERQMMENTMSTASFDGFYGDQGEPDMKRVQATVKTGATSVVFVVPGKNTIKSDNKQHKVTVMINDFPAYFRYSTAPKLMQYAYLKAKIKNTTDYPFLLGTANVFLDNNFITKSTMPNTAPTEEFWTFLGIDEGIKVKHKFIKKYNEEDGLFNKKTKIIYEYLITITNNKKTEEEIVVWDQIPISGNEDIKIELIEPKYVKDTDTLKMNKTNYLEWLFKPKPGEKIVIPFKFSVTYPSDKSVSGLY